MKKIMKNYGNTLVMVFDKEDQQTEGLEEGDIVELTIIKVIKTKKK